MGLLPKDLGMKKTHRNIYYVGGAILIAGLFILLRGPIAKQRIQTISESLGLPISVPTVVSGGSAPHQATIPADAAVAAKSAADFQDWFNQEASQLDRAVSDSKAKEEELKARARSLTLQEMGFLKSQILADRVAANTRIFAAYLLSLAPEATASVLGDLVQEPLRYEGVQKVHSPEETLSMQEKSLRRMAIDALIKRAETEPGYRDELQKVVRGIPDTALREYAQKALDQLR